MSDPNDKILSVEEVAEICHEANRALCVAQDDYSQSAWGDAEDWQKTSSITQVRFFLANPLAGVENGHNNWLKEKEDDGWRYGAVKNPETKEHPCMVPYDELPPEQQAKDYLFRSIVQGLTRFISY